MVEFTNLLQEAKGLLAVRPLRTTLAQAEIDRIAEYRQLAKKAEIRTTGC